MSNESTPMADAREIQALIDRLRHHRPNDRSATDRVYAVALTELEKAYAYFVTYALADNG